MKILFVYPNAEGYSRIPLGPSIIITILSENGHQVDIFDTTFILNEHVDYKIREEAKLVLPTDISHLYDYSSLEKVDEMLREKLKSFSPDLVAASIVEDNYQLADRLLRVAKSVEKNIPTIVGGSTPTVAPEVIIENPCIDYLIQGEGEEALLEFCGLMEIGKSVSGLRNLWYKNNGMIFNNPIRPFVNMDSLPIQNLEFWDERHFIKPYCGEFYKSGFFEMSRGCLNKCTYCINNSCKRILHEAGNYFRKKSIKNIITEIRFLKDKFDLEMIFFCDDNFLLMSQSRLYEFCDAWKTDVNLPFWINTTLETVSREKLSRLQEIRCSGIGFGIESGSEWLRKNILKRKISNKRIVKYFEIVHEFDIRTTANAMIGFPGEYEEDIFETIKLFKKIRPKSYDINFVAPYIGTPIHLISKKMGYIETLENPGFKGMSKDITTRRRPVIKTPNISTERKMSLFHNFSDYIEGRAPIPEKFKEVAPGCDNNAPPRGEMGKEVSEAMQLVDNFDRNSLAIQSSELKK